jgi:hypothetical protein
MVTGNCNSKGDIPTLIRCIRDLKNMNWQVQMNHTWREGNGSTDWPTNFTLTLNSLNLHVLEAHSRELQRLIFYNIFGGYIFRNVRLTM